MSQDAPREPAVHRENCRCWNCSWGRCHECGKEVTQPRTYDGNLYGYRYLPRCGRRERLRERQVATVDDKLVERSLVILASYCPEHLGLNGSGETQEAA